MLLYHDLRHVVSTKSDALANTAHQPRAITLPPMPPMPPIAAYGAARRHDRSFMTIRAERQGPAFDGARKTDVGQNDEATISLLRPRKTVMQKNETKPSQKVTRSN